MVPFGGWEMPLAYEQGTSPSTACCEGAVAFDVSHLGTVRGRAPAYDSLQWALTNDLGKIEPGRAQYTHLDANDGSVTDDIIVWWLEPGQFDVMPNASNTRRVVGALREQTDSDVTVEDVTAERAVIAVQGPEARSRLEKVSADAAGVGRFRSPVRLGGTLCGRRYGLHRRGRGRVRHPRRSGRGVLAGRARRRGDPGGVGRPGHAPPGGRPAAARPRARPRDHAVAGRAGVVAWDKGPFRGREPLEAERWWGSRLLRGLSVEGRRPPRAEQPVLRDGQTVGTVTSGNYSPVLGHGIALAFLTPDVDEGDAVTIDARGAELPATVVPTPFVAPEEAR